MNSRLATTRINVIVPNSFIDNTNTIHIKSYPPINFELTASDVFDVAQNPEVPRILVIRLTILKDGSNYIESLYSVTSARHAITMDAENLVGADLFSVIKLLGGFDGSDIRGSNNGS